MSWITGITGKAEQLLNKLDQSAADALTLTPTKEGPPPPETKISSESNVTVDSSSSFVSKPVKQTSLTKPQRPSDIVTPSIKKPQTIVNPSSTTAQTGSAKKKLNTDEALFDFLNSSEPLDPSKKKVTPSSSARHSRQSSTSSIISNKGGKVPENPPSSNSGSIVHVDSIHGSGMLFLAHLAIGHVSFCHG